MVNCPLCDAEIDVEEDELDEGDSLTCDECGANINVVGVDPLELEAEEEEDDDDEEDDDLYSNDDDEEDW
jgi:alpha-aminoadipate carrier protein LysW